MRFLRWVFGAAFKASSCLCAYTAIVKAGLA
jgi:hypothetical protein